MNDLEHVEQRSIDYPQHMITWSICAHVELIQIVDPINIYITNSTLTFKLYLCSNIFEHYCSE